MEKIKLPRSSYEELKKIISAYGALNKPVGLDDISHATGVGKTVVSANNAFLAGIELIEGGNKKSITTNGAKLSRAIEHEINPEIEATWATIINQNDFLTKMLQAVKIRKGMDVSQLENHIAYSSGEQKTGPVMTGARAIVDILLASGLLKQEGDKLIANQLTNLESQVNSENVTKESAIDTFDDHETVSIIKKHPAGINLNIQVNIDAKPSELDGLGVKIKKIIDDLKDDV